MAKEKKSSKKAKPVKIDMPFEEAMKKILNTPVSKEQRKKIMKGKNRYK